MFLIISIFLSVAESVQDFGNPAFDDYPGSGAVCHILLGGLCAGVYVVPRTRLRTAFIFISSVESARLCNFAHVVELSNDPSTSFPWLHAI